MILKVLLSESQAKLNLTTAEFLLKVAGIDTDLRTVNLYKIPLKYND
ncbi:hypothetical protein [Clostridium sp. BJN0013]